ncbi:hypothetical protein PV327_005042, partial [Microctonus hyperodae]
NEYYTNNTAQDARDPSLHSNMTDTTNKRKMDTNNEDIHHRKIIKQQIKEMGKYYNTNNLERIFNKTQKNQVKPNLNIQRRNSTSGLSDTDSVGVKNNSQDIESWETPIKTRKFLDLCIADCRLEINMRNNGGNTLPTIDYDSDHRAILINIDNLDLTLSSANITEYTYRPYKKINWKNLAELSPVYTPQTVPTTEI